MPSTVSYQRKYYATTYAELDTIPLKEGNVIALSDTDGFYYDVGNPAGSGQNVARRKANGVEIVGSLSEARQEPQTIFVVETGYFVDEDGNTYKGYAGYIWNDDVSPARFDEVFNNLKDFQVKSVVNTSTVAYIVGSQSDSTSTGTLLKNPNIYLTSTGNKIHANIEGKADYAGTADRAVLADEATQAVNDTQSQPILGYIRGISSDAVTNLGSTLTITKGDGTTTTVRVSDTTYDVFTQDATKPGLVNGIDTVAASDNTDLLLTGSGWVDIGNITMPAATSAENDGQNQNIADTYIKDLSYDTTTDLLTVTFGDNDTTTVSIPTTYEVFTPSSDGLVPAPSGAGETAMFLRGDGTWQVVTTADYQGATSGAAGVHGLVPAASSGDTDSYLRSDGTWAGTFAQDTDGLVPGPTNPDPAYSLRADGTWDICPDTKNTAGSTNDTSTALFLVGAAAQSTYAQTYSNQYVYINGGKLYQSNGAGTPAAVQVVDVSSTQALTNKTYEGYTLGTACAATVASSVALDGTLPTGNAVTTYVNGRISSVQTDISTKASNIVVAPNYDDTSTSYAIGDYCMYDDGNGALLYKCTAAITAPAGAFDDTKWASTTITGGILTGTLTAGSTSVTISDASIVAGSILEIYTDVYGLQPTNVAVTTGQIVLTFTAQGTDVNIKIKVV